VEAGPDSDIAAERSDDEIAAPDIEAAAKLSTKAATTTFPSTPQIA
jgi:hypothetical protein